MKKRQINFFSMCLAVGLFYEKYKEQLDTDPVIARLFEEYYELFKQMKDAVQVQKGHTSNAAKQKQIEEDEMIEATVRYASKGFVYADENNLPGLQEKFSVSPSNLYKLSDVLLHSTCSSIYEALSGISAEAIETYGITADDLILLKKEITDFYHLISQPRAEIITRSQATNQIKEIVKKLQLLFTNRLDKMIIALPAAADQIKREYKAARKIIDLSGKRSGDSDVEVLPANE